MPLESVLSFPVFFTVILLWFFSLALVYTMQYPVVYAQNAQFSGRNFYLHFGVNLCYTGFVGAPKGISVLFFLT